jgi:glycosyltransferase involved in cell wall biosynthesis
MFDNGMQKGRITFIIATYRRVEALRCTLRSLQLQSCREWDAIVVGDCCGPETGVMIESIADKRIRYYNFPSRYGEQTGPNNFGMNLATGEYLCFLNHDDLLLADFIEHARDQMVARGSDFHISLAANATKIMFDTKGAIVPVFTSILPYGKELSILLDENPYSFDPSSFWLIRTDYAKKVGSWRHSSGLWRTPLRDWIMRAWRSGGVFSFGDRITGLRFWTQNLRNGAPLYAQYTPEHNYMVKLMEELSPQEIRDLIFQMLKNFGINSGASETGVPETNAGKPVDRMKNKVRVMLFLYFGIDPIEVQYLRAGRKKGDLHQLLLKKRTGETIPTMTDIRSLLLNPESCRVL